MSDIGTCNLCARQRYFRHGDAHPDAAVQADDALLDALRGPNPSPEGDAWLMKMLRAWRDDVDTEPTPQLVDVDTALTIVGARPRRSLSGRVVDVFRRLLGGGW